MTDFEELLYNFKIEEATENEKLLYYAVCALITCVDRLKEQIEYTGKE